MFRKSFCWLVILMTIVIVTGCRPATPAVAPAAAAPTEAVAPTPTLAPTATAAPATTVPVVGPSGQVLWNSAPVAGARLKLAQPGACREGASDTVIATATTDAAGKFTFDKSPAGEFQVCVAWPAGESALGASDVWSPAPLEAGAPVQNVTVKLLKPMQLLSPDMTAAVAVTPTVRWQTLPGVADYRLLIIHAGTTELVSEQKATGDSLTVEQPLKPGQPYQLLVEGRNAGGEVIAQYNGEFKTAGAAVAPEDEPVVQLPANCLKVGLPTYVDMAARLCFAYPQGYTLKKTADNRTEMTGPAIGKGPEPLFASLTMEVVPYQGQDLAPYVDELLKAVPEGFPVKVERKQLTLGGHGAEALEPMPGRLSLRQVVVDFAPQSLFVLTFWPSFADTQPEKLNVESKQAQQDMNALYEMVTTSFATLPPAGVSIDPASAVEVQKSCLVTDQPLYMDAAGKCSAGKPAGTDQAASSGLTKAQYQGISFSYPAALAKDVKGETVPAETGGSDGPWWLPVPAFTRLAFDGYVLKDTAQQPQIVVYPADEFAKGNKEAGDRIAALRKLLQEKPANSEGELPFLPLVNAKQMMHAKMQYVSFAGGSGVRYLTQYAQGMAPLNNGELFYTFQGLTDDGKYYVSAILPLSHKSLPASANAVPADQQKVGEAYAAYLKDAIKALETQADASFQPSLSDLDALVKTITEEPAQATGSGLSQAQYQGVTFSYPAALAKDVKGETVPAETGGSDGPWWLPVPAFTRLAFDGYVLKETSQQPQIVVYPADEFAKGNKEAGDRIAALRKLLGDKPANPEGQMPFLPLFNAAQQMHAQMQYASFVGGHGVRYLTQYAQAIMPLNNQELFYTFQGLTDDGKYYVAAILPLSHKSLPANFESVPADQRKAVGESFDKYMQAAVKSLAAQDAASFQPSLSNLDALVKTIEVKQ